MPGVPTRGSPNASLIEAAVVDFYFFSHEHPTVMVYGNTKDILEPGENEKATKNRYRTYNVSTRLHGLFYN